MASEYPERFQFKSVQLFKDQVLGIGAYGKVCLAKCDLLLCAAKIMHETLFDPSLNEKARPHHEHRLPFSRFKRECEFLSVIRHPNIVQYLGMCRDPDTHLPVLLMELMDSSLSHFLEDSPAPLPFHVQVNICHDILLALFFLHSNGVIHRDLSGNNVLMIGNVRAKVTDFGMAGLIDPSRLSKLTRTMCPGTDVYMPPEAIDDPPIYTEKIDCFAFGVILVQILTRLFPTPTSRKKKVKIDHPGLPEGVVVDVPVPELDRRQGHIKKIQPNHPLLSIAIECLSSKSVDRPSSEQLCESMSALKADKTYRESLKTAIPRAVVSDSKTSTPRVTRQSKTEDTSAKKLQDKERQLEQAKCQLEEGQEIIKSLQNRIEELELAQRSVKQKPSFKFSWKGTKKAPCEMYRGPDAVVSGYVAYFRPTGSRTVYAYDVIHSKWNKMAECPNDKSSLVIIGDLLTTVGGICEGRTTNQLLSLVRGRREEGEGRWPGKWEETFPPMSTRRCRSGVLYLQRSLVVAGGVIDGDIVCNTVEVLNIDTHTWTTAACLPEALYRSSMAVSGNSIYLLGGFDRKNLAVRAVLVCQVDLLLKPRPSFVTSPSTTASSIWSRATDLSVTQSTCVSLRGQLLAVGGMDIDRTNYRSADIRMYDPIAKQWEIIGRMSTPRRRCYAAVLLDEHLMVVGGLADNGRNGMDAFEIASVTTIG